MTKLELVGSIAAELPSELTIQERQHLSFYPSKLLLETIDTALRDARGRRPQGIVANKPGLGGATLPEKARKITQRLRPHLLGYPESKATSELANTTHGVLDKLLEGL